MNNASKNIVRKIVFELENRNIPLNKICTRSGKQLNSFSDEDWNFDENDLECIWEIAVRQTGDEEIGFKIGLSLSIEALGTLGMIMQNSLTVKEALDNTNKYISLLSNLINIDLDYQMDHFLIDFNCSPSHGLLYPFRSKQVKLLALGYCIKVYKSLTLQDLNSKELMIPKGLKQLNILSTYFNSITSTKGSSFTLKLGNECLNNKVLYADINALSMLTKYAAQQLNTKNSEWCKKVENVLVDNYTGNFLSLESVAAHLNMSPRTIQRKLDAEGKSFSTIKDTVREQLAKFYLNNGETTKYISKFLGFSNESSFSKAFNRWTKTTVREYVANI